MRAALKEVGRRDPDFLNKFPNKPSSRAELLHPLFPHIFKD